MGKVNRTSLSPALKRHKYLFDLLKRMTDAYMVIVDMSTHMAMVSATMVQDFDLTGEMLESFVDEWSPLVHPEERGHYLVTVRGLLEKQDVTETVMEYRVRTRKGEYVWVSSRSIVGMDREGRPGICVAVLSRMAQRNQADEVTGLLNKYQFEHSVKLALERCRSTGKGGAILILGLDNFKIVNEAYSRAIGDRVLKNVSRMVENLLPPALTLFKLDGDEFAAILPEATEETVTELFSDIQRGLSRPMAIDGRQYFCTASAGTVFYPQAGKDYLVLYKHAEAALDIAKREGKNRNVIFSKEQYNRWVRSISMRDSLWESVEKGCEGFSLFFQPQVDAHDQRLIGAEALLRWMGANGRMVSPMEFIPILEETQLILPVGKWVFEEAVRNCLRWRRIVPNFKVSVNMSYEQVKDPSFKDFVHACIRRYGIDPKAIVLELTESKIVADWNFVNREFDSFRSKGIEIAMDDFGTGYSSLSTLKNLSCDIVKIDREFVKQIRESEFDRKLVTYSVDLCHSIGIRTCIEGVEEDEDYRILRDECHADSIQGYLFGRPESVESFEQKFLGG